MVIMLRALSEQFQSSFRAVRAFTVSDLVAVGLQVVDEPIADVIAGVISLNLDQELNGFGNAFGEALLVLLHFAATLLHTGSYFASFYIFQSIHIYKFFLLISVNSINLTHLSSFL